MTVGYLIGGIVMTIALFMLSFLFDDAWRTYLRLAAVGIMVIVGFLIYGQLNSGMSG